MRHFLSSLRLTLAIAACTLLLFACAMSPQTIVIKPTLNIQSMPIGHRRNISVGSRDLRRSATIGMRGGLYDSANISTDTSMTRSITQAAITVLQSWDFAALPATLDHNPASHFEINVLAIDYERPVSEIAGHVTVKCRVAVRVRMGGETFSGEYTSKFTEQVAVQPTANDNIRMVNQTLNQALSEIFLDPALKRFLAN